MGAYNKNPARRASDHVALYGKYTLLVRHVATSYIYIYMPGLAGMHAIPSDGIYIVRYNLDADN